MIPLLEQTYNLTITIVTVTTIALGSGWIIGLIWNLRQMSKEKKEKASFNSTKLKKGETE